MKRNKVVIVNKLSNDIIKPYILAKSPIYYTGGTHVMKISKVNHTRAGVSIAEKQSNGILYENPLKTNSGNSINLKQHVEDLNKNAKNLYSIFITVRQKGGSDKKKNNFTKSELQMFEDIRNFSTGLKKEVLCEYRNNVSMEKNISYQLNKLEQWITKNSTGKNSLSRYESFQTIMDEDVDRTVDVCLRNSLRKFVRIDDSGQKTYIPDLIKKLLKTVILANSTHSEPLSDAEKESLLRVLNEDYGKCEALKKIVHSIESQNVHVSPVEKDGKMLLQLSSAEHKQKKYIFAFLKKFATAEIEEQNKMILHMKRLILLFYCGKSKYEDALSVDANKMSVWSWRFLQDESIVNYDDEIYNMIIENSSPQKKLRRSIPGKLQEKIAESYRNAVKTEGITEEDIFWLQFIENSAEKLLLSKKNVSPIKLSVSYLCEHTFREWTSYICTKYIALGKGVYHFTVPKDTEKVITGEATIGEVLPEYRSGITSFDYEKIKAEETLSRDLSLYTAFAVNNFAMSVMSSENRAQKGNEDILSVKKLENLMYQNADTKILRFWGGESTWSDDVKPNKTDLVNAVREALQSVRNCNFHYSTGMSMKPGEHIDVLRKLFQKEFVDAGSIYRKKFYSNNVWMFYSEKDIKGLLNVLYQKELERPAQIPAFNKIINKANLEETINVFIKGKKKKKLTSGDNSIECMEKFRNCLFFVLKEIYYYGFLQNDDVITYFKNAMDSDTVDSDSRDSKKQEEAHDNFKKYFYNLECNNKEMTFGEICQQIMTEYNQQNQGNCRVASNLKDHDDEKYKHFRALLYRYIKKAFWTYLKQDCYLFLREPERKETSEKPEFESFCKDWRPELYDSLAKRMNEDDSLPVWYTMAHFLNRKQLNMMIGCIKNYIQYMQDVERRRRNTGNCIGIEAEQEIYPYKNILPVLEFSMLFCGNITNCFEDYFKDEDDYAAHLASYVDFGGTDKLTLEAFCSHRINEGSPTGTIGLYYDEQEPIINRNIVYASMYGNEALFCKNHVQKITEQQIRAYYKCGKTLAKVFKSGTCENREEAETLRKFQNEKNHIELTDITTYSEIVNDLMGQLISWAYLRERDLMYYQLGVHYIRLFHSDCVEESSPLRKLCGDGISIQDGAVLYQIIAMYTYHLHVLTFDKTGNIIRNENASSNGASVKAFFKDYCKDKGEIYSQSLCLFEDTEKGHDEMVEFRNYIDHFKYYSHLDRSIMDLYSDVYDRFFTYDIKLRKSVSFIFSNILAKYFVLAETSMQLGESLRYTKDAKDKMSKRKAAKLSIKALKSDGFHLSKNVLDQNVPSAKKCNMIMARSDAFLGQLQKILEYKECTGSFAFCSEEGAK